MTNGTSLTPVPPAPVNIPHDIKKDCKVRVKTGFWEDWRGLALDQKFENGVELINVKLIYCDRPSKQNGSSTVYFKDFIPSMLEVIQ